MDRADPTGPDLKSEEWFSRASGCIIIQENENILPTKLVVEEPFPKTFGNFFFLNLREFHKVQIPKSVWFRLEMKTRKNTYHYYYYHHFYYSFPANMKHHWPTARQTGALQTLVLSSWANPVQALANRKSPLRTAILFPNCMSFSGPSETVHSFRLTMPRCTRKAVWISSVISAKLRWLGTQERERDGTKTFIYLYILFSSF